MDRMGRRIGVLAALALSLAGGLRAELTMPIEGKLNFVNGGSFQNKAEDALRSIGGEVSLYLSPLLAWEDSKWYWTAAYDMDYSNVNTLMRVDDELFNFVQRFNNVIDVGGGWRARGHKISYKLYTETFNGKEALDDVWWLGPYDYRDGGLRLTYTRSVNRGGPYIWNLGLKTTDRVYPNWTSLDPGARKEKDQAISKFFFDWNKTWRRDGPFSTFFAATLQDIRYKESYIVDGSGQTTDASGGGTLRADNIFSLSGDFMWDFEVNHFVLTLRSQTRDSNFNYYDSAQNEFVADYNDYTEGGLDASYSHDYEGPWWILKKPQLTLGLNASTRRYKARLAKDDKGQYTRVPQADTTLGVHLGLNSPVTKHWSLNSSFDYAAIDSNNLDQSSSVSRYKLLAFRLGTQFAY